MWIIRLRMPVNNKSRTSVFTYSSFNPMYIYFSFIHFYFLSFLSFFRSLFIFPAFFTLILAFLSLYFLLLSPALLSFVLPFLCFCPFYFFFPSCLLFTSYFFVHLLFHYSTIPPKSPPWHCPHISPTVSERRGWVLSTLAPYAGNPGFKFRSGDGQPWQVFVFPVSLSRQMPTLVHSVRQLPLASTSFPVH